MISYRIWIALVLGLLITTPISTSGQSESNSKVIGMLAEEHGIITDTTIDFAISTNKTVFRVGDWDNDNSTLYRYSADYQDKIVVRDLTNVIGPGRHVTAMDIMDNDTIVLISNTNEQLLNDSRFLKFDFNGNYLGELIVKGYYWPGNTFEVTESGFYINNVGTVWDTNVLFYLNHGGPFYGVRGFDISEEIKERHGQLAIGGVEIDGLLWVFSEPDPARNYGSEESVIMGIDIEEKDIVYKVDIGHLPQMVKTVGKGDNSLVTIEAELDDKQLSIVERGISQRDRYFDTSWMGNVVLVLIAVVLVYSKIKYS